MKSGIDCLSEEFKKKCSIYDGTVIAYGIGNFYYQVSSMVENFYIDYVMDAKWADSDIHEFNGIPIASDNDLKSISNPIMIVFPRSSSVFDFVKGKYFDMGIPVFDAKEAYSLAQIVKGKEINDLCGEYKDDHGNKIIAEGLISSNIQIVLLGRNNTITLGRMISAKDLRIDVGNNSCVTIGDKTTFLKASVQASYSNVMIGKDCMFSDDVIIRAHDGHHIFDMSTGERINHPRDVIVGNHVWIGRRATLFGGAKIGDGSIVGGNATTASTFEKNVIIAGNPAKVIRENIVWDRESTFYFDRDYYSECSDYNENNIIK